MKENMEQKKGLKGFENHKTVVLFLDFVFLWRCNYLIL